MQTAETIRRKIESAESLAGIVSMMKAISAVSIRKYEQAVESLADYSLTVERGLWVALGAELEVADPGWGEEMPLGDEGGRGRKGGPGSIAAVLFGTDQGLCGSFNDQVARHAVAELGNAPGKIVTVGLRGANALLMAGRATDELLPAPGSLAAVTGLVQELLIRLADWQASGQYERVLLFHNRYRAGAAAERRTVQLAPLDLSAVRSLPGGKWPTRVLPTYRMARRELVAALVREYLFVNLYRAAAESLAAEHGIRLMTMQEAERNIGERLDGFHFEGRRLRQDAITSELLDIVGGFEAVGAG